MRLPEHIARGVAEGSVTLAFHRWDEVPVSAGDVFETGAGPVRIDSVEPAHSIADADAQAAGYDSPPALALALTGEGALYRVELSPASSDEREPAEAH